MTQAEQEFLKKIEGLKYVINTTKSWRCKQDHIKALKKCERELNFYRKNYYKNIEVK